MTNQITVTPYDDIRWKSFKASTGTETFMWAFGRSAKSGAWFLRDSDGYIRTLQSTWADSVPLIQATVANYGMTCAVN